MSGLNWKMLEKKWPGIGKAFAGFDIDNVASFGESEINALMDNTDVIRNRPKITAIVSNAREFQAVADEFGSFAKYLDSIRPDGEEAMKKAISKRFVFMGPGTSTIFLFACGESMPEATKRWHEQHEG